MKDKKCEFCEKRITNIGSLAAHEKSCTNNPNRVKRVRSPMAGKKKGSVGWGKGMKFGPSLYYENKFPDEKIFVVDSTYPRHSIKTRILRKKLIEYKCSICSIGPVWCEKPMPLILDHINGINNDNRLENLRFVCGHCDSQLPTYKSKNRKNIESNVQRLGPLS